MISNFLFSYKVKNIDFFKQIISVFCLINVILLIPNFFDFFSKNGLINETTNSKIIENSIPLLKFITEPLELIGLQYKLALLLIIATYFISLIFVLSNYYSFAFSIMAWFIHIMLVNSSYFFSYGADYFISFSLFINIFFCLPISIQNTEIEKVIHSFIIRFVQIQLCFVYFFSGFGKILGTNWFDGNAMWYVINTFSPKSISIYQSLFGNSPIFFISIGLITVFFELFYPFLVFYKKTRTITLTSIIFIHIGIIVFMKFYTFGLIMIILNLIAWDNYINFKIIQTFSNKINKYRKK
jgi:hypothetical protein